jgi:energy-coupling factor transporter ATP-binding protein EcfA2
VTELFSVITPDQFADLLGIEPGGMRVLVGNKGMGKSAIVEWLHKVSHNRKLACVLLRPDNLETKDLPTSQDVGSLKRHFYETLLRSICGQVGSQLKGLLHGEAASLYKTAQAQGLAPQDLIQKSLALLSAVATPVAKVDGVRLAKELSGSDSPNALIRAVNGQLLSAGSVLFLLIDDTDQVASPSTPAHLNRIWALLLAVRRLVGECSHIRAIVTLRSEIWSRLTSESDGQRDQTDHLRGSRVLLRATDNLIESIIRRRLQEAAKDANVHGVDPYTLFFKGTSVTLPTSTVERSWDSFLVKSSRERPRDAIQLIKNMIDRAKARGTDIIGSAEADEAMTIYSKERVDDLNNEFAPDCSSIRQIISTFSDVAFEADFEAIRRHVSSIPSSFSVTIRGEQLKPQDDTDAITLLALLHETGFINPRVPDARETRNFRHILFNDNPHFVKMANWNEMQGAKWEVHPAFRSFLIHAKRDTLARAVNKQP